MQHHHTARLIPAQNTPGRLAQKPDPIIPRGAANAIIPHLNEAVYAGYELFRPDLKAVRAGKMTTAQFRDAVRHLEGLGFCEVEEECETCGGRGEVVWNNSRDPQNEMVGPCPECENEAAA